MWIYDQIIYEYYLNLLYILISMIKYLCIYLQIIDLVWPTRLVFLATGEVLSFGFNLAVSSPSDKVGVVRHVFVLLPSRVVIRLQRIYNSIRCNIVLQCVFRDPMNCEFMIRLSMNISLVFSELFYA